MGLKNLVTILISLGKWYIHDTYVDGIEYTVDSKRQVSYLVISKAACSSIKASMIDRELSEYDPIHYTATQLGMRRDHLSDEEKDFFTFTFVRNPFDRLVSCYVGKLHDEPEKRGRNEFAGYLGGYLLNSGSFDVFVKKICVIPDRLMDRHICPQYLQVFRRDGTSRVGYIGHFEHLEDEFREIQEKYGLHPLKHFNKSSKEDYRDYYTIKTARKVYRKYRKDIRAFGYEEDYRKLIAYIKEKKNG